MRKVRKCDKEPKVHCSGCNCVTNDKMKSKFVTAISVAEFSFDFEPGMCTWSRSYCWTKRRSNTRRLKRLQDEISLIWSWNVCLIPKSFFLCSGEGQGHSINDAIRYYMFMKQFDRSAFAHQQVVPLLRRHTIVWSKSQYFLSVSHVIELSS